MNPAGSFVLVLVIEPLILQQRVDYDYDDEDEDETDGSWRALFAAHMHRDHELARVVAAGPQPAVEPGLARDLAWK